MAKFDLKTKAGRAYSAYLRRTWRRKDSVALRLAGSIVRFQGLGEPPFDWFGYEMHRGRWEREVLRFYANAIVTGDVILDIGAFIGAYALLGSQLVGPTGQVFAFEPDPVAREHLERNVSINGATNIEIVPAAVSDSDGEISLDASRLGSSQTSVGGSDSSVVVPTVALDDYCCKRNIRPAVIKIDVEGAEEHIIGPAAAETLSGARAVILEMHETKGVDSDRIRGLFEQWGKRLVQLEERWPGQSQRSRS